MKRVLLLTLALLLTAAGCAAPQTPAEDDTLTIVTTTYPIYLFARAVTEGVDGVTVERLNTGETSCLHDYTLSVSDMKLLDRADVIAMNGAGLEEFLEDALATSGAAVIDCSQGVELLENLHHHHEEEAAHEGHDHGHYDPHYWMDPANAQIMLDNLTGGLSELDADHSETYRRNCGNASVRMEAWEEAARDTVQETGAAYPVSGLITFHDGFQYFARAYGLPLLESIEEEAGSEASAHEIVEISELVKEKRIPVIFTEVNGSDATARAISRETGCQVAQLTMLMDGPDDGELSNYLDGLMSNVKAIANGFAEEEIIR